MSIISQGLHHPDPDIEAGVTELIEFERYFGRRLRHVEREAMAAFEGGALVRAVFLELRSRDGGPSWLAWRLGVDRSQLSRALAYLEACGYLSIEPSGTDRRGRNLRLTAFGRDVVRSLESEERDRARGLVLALPRRHRERLLDAMAAIREILERDALANLIDSRPGSGAASSTSRGPCRQRRASPSS